MSWLVACGRWVSAAAGAVMLLAGADVALAGRLILRNTSNATISCTVDGWTNATGANYTWTIQVQPNIPFQVNPNAARPGGPVINWVQCGALPATRQMNITPGGPNQTLVLNGQQTRVLNVSLYPYLPTTPNDRFETLVDHVVQTYQAQNPQVLLNAVMNPAVNIYDFDNLPRLLNDQGFDVVELDTLYLGFLADRELINPAQITGQAPRQVALAAATYKNQLYGIPSWLCMDFVYSTDPGVQGQKTVDELRAFLALAVSPDNRPRLAAVYNGSWRLPSIYINSYVQNYGYAAIAQATQMPPDKATIDQLDLLINTCAFDQSNYCIDGVNKTRQDASSGYVERLFSTNAVGAVMGFSEQAFFMRLYGMAAQLYVAPAPWGKTRQPLLFSDAFVSSRTTCAANTPCAGDARAFTDLMTDVPMKNYIVQSQDLPAGTPQRPLLVSTLAFWQQQAIQNDPLYRQYTVAIAAGQPFPNTFTPDLQKAMGVQICAAIKDKQPAFACKKS